MIPLHPDTWREQALELSRQHPDKYITISNTFGPFAHLHDRLHVFAPTDSAVDEYYRNGKAQKFTDAQRAADSAATPNLS